MTRDRVNFSTTKQTSNYKQEKKRDKKRIQTGNNERNKTIKQKIHNELTQMRTIMSREELQNLNDWTTRNRTLKHQELNFTMKIFS